MAVLVNSETGEAENLSQNAADVAIATGTHKIPMVDAHGNPTMASLEEAQDALSNGYKQAEGPQLQNLLDQTKYGTSGETTKAALESAASAATLGLSTGAERALGVKAEDIQKRREILEQQHPILKGVAELGGLAASSAIPIVGEANVLGTAGKLAAGAAERVLPRIVATVGSPAARMMTETALFQLGDEASKMFSSDPNQSAETALADVKNAGLYGAVLGGAFGLASPLWAAANESRLGQMLNAIKDRANGVVKNAPTPEISQMIEKSGIEVPGVVRSALGDSPDVRNMFNLLQESSTGAGKDAQEALTQFRHQANEQILKGLGKTPDQVNAIADSFSEADAGNDLKQKLVKEVKNTVDPLSSAFKKIREEFAGVEFTDADQARISNELQSLNEKYAISPSSPEYQKINLIIKELPNIKTLEDFRNFQSVHLGDIANKQLWSINSSVRDIMRNLEEDILVNSAAKESPELMVEHEAARAGYRDAMQTIDALNDRLHVGKYYGPDSFLHALNEMRPEEILRRITSKNDSELLTLLSNKFPGVTQAVRENYINQALSIANKRAVHGEAINPTTLFNVLDKWSPELKQFAMSPEANSKISAIRGLLDAVPTYKSSGTAKNIDSLWSKVPAGVGGIMGALRGHDIQSGIAGYLIGTLGKLIARDVPDAIRLSTLKYLGNGQPINARGYKAMVDFTSSIINGENNLNKAAKNIFKAGAVAAPSLQMNDQKREKLDRKLRDLQSNNNADLLNIGNEHGYYLPQHTSALTASITRGVNYLNSIRPTMQKLGPLDPELPPSKSEISKYNRAMDVVNQPLTVFEHIKNGTITQDDVMAMHQVYPSLYTRASQKLTNEMIEHVSKGNIVPYKTRLGLSLFMGGAMDSTMTPQAIMATQPLPTAPINPAGGPKKKGSMKDVNKIATMSQTRDEARSMHRIQKG